ncbi:MAG: T9SS type A sorting domain-containing protein, partial [Candidatus Symbiothrix sp.]|nr:T9SS type A sorting domain-containing protein [Candidatus Symbiothrix sp.]
ILSITGAENATLTVLNLQGQTVYAKHKLSVTENIPVISWAKGVYLIILQTGNNRIVNKIIKK